MKIRGGSGSLENSPPVLQCVWRTLAFLSYGQASHQGSDARVTQYLGGRHRRQKSRASAEDRLRELCRRHGFKFPE